MLTLNHTRVFRPLLGGIHIHNPRAVIPGTLGCIAEDENGTQWIVSAYHVLVRSDGSLGQAGEPIFQPSQPESTGPIAELVDDRADRMLDIAAARLVDGITGTTEILGIGIVSGVLEPQQGMRVVKSGTATGVTEGIVREVANGRVEIGLPNGFPSKYELSFRGDSGAVWVERESRSAICLHVAGEDTGEEKAFGVPMSRVLNRLQLALA